MGRVFWKPHGSSHCSCCLETPQTHWRSHIMLFSNTFAANPYPALPNAVFPVLYVMIFSVGSVSTYLPASLGCHRQTRASLAFCCMPIHLAIAVDALLFETLPLLLQIAGFQRFLTVCMPVSKVGYLLLEYSLPIRRSNEHPLLLYSALKCISNDSLTAFFW